MQGPKRANIEVGVSSHMNHPRLSYSATPHLNPPARDTLKVISMTRTVGATVGEIISEQKIFFGHAGAGVRSIEPVFMFYFVLWKRLLASL